MLPTTALPSFLIAMQITYGAAGAGLAGRVVAAPHDGYDQYSGTIARAVSRRLRWGWVRAIGYRSWPLRFWFDVNRPSERTWSSSMRGFRSGAWTGSGQSVYDEYQRKLRRAGKRSSGALEMLVEIHGHSRSVRAGGRNMRLEVIELATSGFTTAKLRRVKQHYQTLLQQIPSSQRVPLAIDRLDATYAYRGWNIGFYFHARAAKRSGSLRSTSARKALHFELPPRVRTTYSARSNYTVLLARLVEYARKL